MNDVEVAFVNIQSGNFKHLHYKILKCFPVGIFRAPD